MLPGFIQTHIHLCQTLFRGYADDLPLMDWLRTRVWPMEAAHTPASLRAAARLAATELLRGGTTSVLTMETVHDTDVVFEAVAASGLRATIGKCMMDVDAAGAGAAAGRRRSTSIDESLAHSQALARRGRRPPARRLRAAIRRLVLARAARGRRRPVGRAAGAGAHARVGIARRDRAGPETRTGMDNIAYLAATGLASPRLCAAHCVWVDDASSSCSPSTTSRSCTARARI